MLIKFPWCSGYHICLTRRWSPVRSRAETYFFLFIFHVRRYFLECTVLAVLFPQPELVIWIVTIHQVTFQQVTAQAMTFHVRHLRGCRVSASASMTAHLCYRSIFLELLTLDSKVLWVNVVYFHQRTHACACICIVKNKLNIQTLVYSFTWLW